MDNVLTSETQLTDLERLKIFVGEEKKDFYFKKWGLTDSFDWTTDEKVKFKPSWNWASLFFHEFWMAFRKMYVEASIIVVISVVITFLLTPIKSLVVYIPGIVLTLFISIYGNSLYLLKARREIIKIKQLGLSREEEIERLKKAGGTSYKRAFAFLGIELVIGFIIGIVGGIMGVNF